MNKHLFILLFCTFAAVSTRVAAQKSGVVPLESSAMDYLYQQPARWSGAHYDPPRKAGERIYLTFGADFYSIWNNNESLTTKSWGLAERLGIGYQLSPIHTIEFGASIVSPQNMGNYTRLDASYLFNLSSYASKLESPGRWELQLRSGFSSTFRANAFSVEFMGSSRVKYNLSPTIGLYVEPGISVSALSNSNAQSAFVGGSVMPTLSLGITVRPSSIKRSVAAIVEERRDRLLERGYDTKPLFAIKSNLLYDAMSIINIGVDIPIKERYSIGVDLLCPWWTWDDGTVDSKCNRLQLVNANVEGRYWFGDRSNHSVMTGWFAGLFMGGGLYDFERDGEGYQGEFILMGGVSGGYVHAINRKKTLRMEYSLGVGYMRTDYKEYSALYGTDGVWHAIERSNGVYSWFGPTRVNVGLSWLINYKKMKGGRR